MRRCSRLGSYSRISETPGACRQTAPSLPQSDYSGARGETISVSPLRNPTTTTYTHPIKLSSILSSSLKRRDDPPSFEVRDAVHPTLTITHDLRQQECKSPQRHLGAPRLVQRSVEDPGWLAGGSAEELLLE